MEGLDAFPTARELNRAIDKLPTGKAPELDDISPKAIKCIVGEVFAHVALGRLQKIVGSVYPESQCQVGGFHDLQFSPFDNYRRNAANRRNHYTLLSSTS